MPNLVIGGDSNLVLCELDRLSKAKYIKTQTDYLVEEWMADRDLIDIWRVRNPEKRRYTFRQRNKAGITHSRLDRWITDIHMQYEIKSCEILTSTLSVHNPVLLEINKNNEIPNNRGHWKFNQSLLKDEEYILKVKNKVAEAKENYNNSDPGIFLTLLKLN